MPAPQKFDISKAVPLTPPDKFDVSNAIPLDSAPSVDFTSNPKSEGLYKMISPSDKWEQVPYSKVMDAWKGGYKISPVDQTRFAEDRVADLNKTSKKKVNVDNVQLPEAVPTIGPAPTFGSKDWVKVKGYNAIGDAADLLPTIGGVGGGLAAGALGIESGPGALAAAAGGAALGGAAGEAGREKINEKLFHDFPLTPKQRAKDIAIQGVVQGVSELSGGLAGKALAPAAKYFEDTALASREAGARLLPSEARGKAPTYIEKFLKGSVATGGKMEQFRTLQNTETKAAVEKIANGISNFSGTPEELGTMVQDGIEAHKANFRAIQNKMYGDIDQAVEEKMVYKPVNKVVGKGFGQQTKTVMEGRLEGPAMPSTEPLKEFARKELTLLNQQEKILDPNVLSSSRGMLQTIIDSPDRVTFKAMASTRSDLLALTRRLDEALPGKQAGFAKKLASLADDSMMDAAEKSGIPDLPEKIRAANEYTANEHKMFEQALVKKIVETKKPEAIASLLKGKAVGNEELRDLFTVLPKNLHQSVQRQVLVDSMTEATDPASKIFNERAFAESIAKIGDERGKIIFGGNWNNIKKLTSLMEKINGPTGMGGGTGAALQNMSLIKGGLLATAVFAFGKGHDKTAAAAAGLALGTNISVFRGVAYALTNPEITAKLIKAMQGVAHASPYIASGTANELIGQAKRRNPNGIRVVAPDGSTHIFPNKVSADNFRKEAGIQ